MFSRVLSLALCLVCAPAFAETITGQYNKLVLDGDDGPFLIDDPAAIGQLVIFNSAHVAIDGGTFSSIELAGTSLDIRGGRLRAFDQSLFAWDGTTIDLHVVDITPESLVAIDRLMAGSGRFGSVRMRLASGDLFAPKLGTPIDGSRPRWNVIYAGESMMDIGIDGMIGIDELNAVRNTFGSDAAAGDFDLSGEVGVGDLNLVRNHFGSSYFPVRNDASAVPEPSTLVLLSISAVLLLQIRHRRPSPGRAGSRANPTNRLPHSGG